MSDGGAERTTFTHPSSNAMVAAGERDPDEPVYMVNLLRFEDQAKPGHGADGLTGKQAFAEYSRRFAALESRFGGKPVWVGRTVRGASTIIGPSDERWDLVAVVRYPSRASFLAMQDSPEYQAIAPLRTAAVADSRLYETTEL